MSADAEAAAAAAAAVSAEAAAVASEAAAVSSEAAAVEAAAASAEAGDASEGKSAEAPATKKTKKWLPLESNPAVMNKYIEGLGWPTAMFKYVDVLAPEDWAAAMVPRPCKAVMLLFPIKEASEKHRDEEAARIAADGQKVAEDLYYTKQTVGNACGTVGIIHAVANSIEDVPCREGSFFTNFVARTKAMTPDERAAALEADEALDAAQDVATREGQTAVPDIDDRVNAHFICFVHKAGSLYELDGRKATPINHGDCTADTVLEKSLAVVKQFIARDPGEIRFAITALVANTGDDF